MQTADDQKAVGSNTGTIYRMDVSNASYYINMHKNNKNKGSGMGHTKKLFLNKEGQQQTCICILTVSNHSIDIFFGQNKIKWSWIDGVHVEGF